MGLAGGLGAAVSPLSPDLPDGEAAASVLEAPEGSTHRRVTNLSPLCPHQGLSKSTALPWDSISSGTWKNQPSTLGLLGLCLCLLQAVLNKWEIPNKTCH